MPPKSQKPSSWYLRDSPLEQSLSQAFYDMKVTQLQPWRKLGKPETNGPSNHSGKHISASMVLGTLPLFLNFEPLGARLSRFGIVFSSSKGP
ncbi:hypothetical protein EV2_035898 [Malus domestica]